MRNVEDIDTKDLSECPEEISIDEVAKILENLWDKENGQFRKENENGNNCSSEQNSK